MVLLTSKAAAHGIRLAGGFLLEVLQRPCHNNSKPELNGPHPHHRPNLMSWSGFTLSSTLFASCWCKDAVRPTIHSFAFINWCIWTMTSQVPLSRLFLPCWLPARRGCRPRPLFPSSTQTLRAPSSCWNVNPRFSCVCYGCAGPQWTHNAVTT